MPADNYPSRSDADPDGRDADTLDGRAPRYYPELLGVLETLPPAQQELAVLTAAELVLDTFTRYATQHGLDSHIGPVTSARETGERYSTGEASHAALAAAVNDVHAALAALNGSYAPPEQRAPEGFFAARDALEFVASALGELDTPDPRERAAVLASAMFRALANHDADEPVADTAAWWQRLRDRLAVRRAVISDLEPASRDRGDEPATKHRPRGVFRIHAWRTDDLPDTAIIELHGGFSFNGEELESAFRYARTALGARRLILDLHGMTYLNELDIGSLSKLIAEVEDAGGRVVSTNAQPKLQVVLDMLGLSAMYNVVPDMAAARAAVEAHAAGNGG